MRGSPRTAPRQAGGSTGARARRPASGSCP
jgi:hypothetical protein